MPPPPNQTAGTRAAAGVDADGDGVEEVDDGNDLDPTRDLPPDDFMGNFGEADVATFCAGHCRRIVGGDGTLTHTRLTEISGLSCLSSVTGAVEISNHARLLSGPGSDGSGDHAVGA
jgi:hypothetical protein